MATTKVAKCVPTTVDHFINIPNWSLLMTSVIAGVISLAIGFGIGWYVKGRGLSGVKVDVANTEKTVSDVISQAKQTVASPTVV